MAYGDGMYDYSARELASHLGNAKIEDALNAIEATGACKFFAYRNGARQLLVNVRCKDKLCLYESGICLAWLCIGDEDFRLPSQKEARKDLDIEFVVYPDVASNIYDKLAQEHIALAREAQKALVEALESVHAKWHYGNAY